MWGHPGHTQQMATLPSHRMGHVPERCRRARGRCRGYWWKGVRPKRRTPRASYWAHGLGMGLLSGPSMGLTMEEGRKPHLNSPWILGGPQLGTLTGLCLWWLHFSSLHQGPALSTGPSAHKPPPWSPSPTLSQHLVTRQQEGTLAPRIDDTDSMTKDGVPLSLRLNFLLEAETRPSGDFPIPSGRSPEEVLSW